MLKIAFLNLFRNKTRTGLSLLGIIIGVAAIISLVSVVDGLFNEVNKAVGQIQGIRVAQSSGPPLYSRLDISFEERIESISGVSLVLPLIVGPIGLIDGKQLSFGNTQIFGFDFSKQKRSLTPNGIGEIIEGREIKAGERGVVVIGEIIKKDYGKFVGQNIEINNTKLKIVGVYATGSQLLNSAILVPINDAREILNFPTDKVSIFNVEIDNPQKIQTIVSVLNFRFGEDLKASSASDLSDQFGGILGSFRLLVGAVAAISGIVAGVGIINTMLMSVLERFKEIGALKAVGWTNSNIVRMIMYESVLIGFFGAITGIIVGFIISILIQSTFGLTTLITFELLAEVFIFALTLGIIGGVYPAYIASKMDPVEALRAE